MTNVMEWKVVDILRRVLQTEDDDGYLVIDGIFSPTARQIAVLILGLITALIIVTVIFEFVKDVAIESADKYMRPIVLTLFAEMTVLGFISLCSYVITYGGTLDDWSTSLFGIEGYIESVLEEVHYFIFLVMIMTIVQVFILVAIGNSCNEKFEEFNILCQDKEEIKEYLEKIDELPHVTTASWMYDYFTGPLAAWDKHANRCKVEEVCIFYALRREHLLHRDPLPPFLPAPKENQLPANFDYAHYLSLCLSRFLNKLVLFTPLSWFGLWIFAFIIFGVMMAVDGVWMAVAGVILVLGYVDMFCMFALEDKCNYIYEHLVNPSHLLHDLEEEISESEARRSGTSSHGKDESKDPESLDEEKDAVDAELKERNLHEVHSSVLKRVKGRALNEEQVTRADLPKISEIPKKERKQSVVSRLVVGKIPPNRHEALFFFDKLGPGLNVYFLRLHLLLQSIYYSVMVCFFIPFAFSEYGVIVGVCFLIIALLPIPIQYMGFYGRLIVQMSHVQSTGMLKDLEVEKVVVRTQKMDRLVKLMVIFEKIEAAKEMQREESGGKKERKLNQKMCDQVEFIGSMFDKYASRNKMNLHGELPIKELPYVLKSIGLPLDTVSLKRATVALDRKGLFSKAALQEWFLNKTYGKPKSEEGKEGENSSVVVVAKKFFQILDAEHSGEIPVALVKVKFLSFREPPYCAVDLDEDIIDELLGHFDEEQTGIIEFEKFMLVFEEMEKKLEQGNERNVEEDEQQQE